MRELRFPVSVRMKNGTLIIPVVCPRVPATASIPVARPLIMVWLERAGRVRPE